MMADGLRLTAVKDFGPNLAAGDFTQRNDAGFVTINFDQRRTAQGQLTGTVRGSQSEVEAIGNSFQTIINSDAGHEL
jgi:hypothetical protein